jgi:hypothetical protein
MNAICQQGLFTASLWVLLPPYICAPAIVHAAGLMPARRVLIVANAIIPKNPIYLGYAGALRLHRMKQALKSGWDAKIDGQTFCGISERQARKHVAIAEPAKLET